MKLHEREMIVAAADVDLSMFILKLMEKHDLTAAETCQMLAGQIATVCKYQIRVDRHGDASKPGGLAD